MDLVREFHRQTSQIAIKGISNLLQSFKKLLLTAPEYFTTMLEKVS